MRLTVDERDTLIMGAFIGGGGAALLLVFDLFWRFPWQVVLLLVAGMVVLGGLIAAMSLADVRREADRRESSRVSLLAWAVLNEGRCETDLAAFTADREGWELPASPLFCGTLLAVGHRDGVEVGIACSTDWDLEGGTIWRMTVLVRLSEERSPARLRRREIHRLGLPQGVVSVSMGGRELCVRYQGWPDDFVALNARVDAAVHLAASLQEA
ncbi:hypothetical protein ABT150_33255 [Streptomyces mirabilis]|uniref:hypothetical protein n=1 Tax=Streptomyces mirabilis TaxID=68239 RepID=UPI0033178F95